MDTVFAHTETMKHTTKQVLWNFTMEIAMLKKPRSLCKGVREDFQRKIKFKTSQENIN